MFRTVSQVMIAYRGSPLSQGKAGSVHGGDRLPWVVTGGVDNYRSLDRMQWQLHVYGRAGEALAAWCGRNNLPLEIFEWRREHGEAGLARDGLYLLRPDTYVALAVSGGSFQAVEAYLASRRIVL